jgi:hypothetical protein
MFKKEFEYGFAIFSKEQLDPTDAIYSKVENKSKYRYYYHLDICPKRTLLYIMVNPSTADDYDMDTTMRNCISLASEYGFNAISVVNLYPERATKFKKCEHCKAHDRNIKMINKAIIDHSDIVLAWGSYESEYINEIKFVFSEINQCNLRQDNEFANLKEQIDKMKQYNEFVNIQEQINKINKIIEDKEHNIKDIETKIHDIEKKINNINNERAEETFLKNIRTKH